EVECHVFVSPLLFYHYSACAAVINASLYTSSSLHPLDKSFTGLFNPCKIGPTASKPPKRSVNLYPIFPASKLGNTNTVASPWMSESGAFFCATVGTHAASNLTCLSTARLASFSFAILTPSITRSVSSDFADPLVEKLYIATFGSISNNFAVRALSTAISAKSALFGAILIAQSANTY